MRLDTGWLPAPATTLLLLRTTKNDDKAPPAAAGASARQESDREAARRQPYLEAGRCDRNRYADGDDSRNSDGGVPPPVLGIAVPTAGRGPHLGGIAAAVSTTHHGAADWAR